MGNGLTLPMLCQSVTLISSAGLHSSDAMKQHHCTSKQTRSQEHGELNKLPTNDFVSAASGHGFYRHLFVCKGGFGITRRHLP
jgi:hypothetical protein